MVFSADDLVVWRDFPKGLRVLLLDQDGNSAAETKSKLEAMDYVVSAYCNVKDALEAISSDVGGFHVAIIEVTSDNCNGSFKFLEVAKDFPTVAISDVHCLSTMMKCIALGAAEFLQKPLSEDKIRNIWQHVVHKAFNARGTGVSKSLEPIKETIASILLLHSDTNASKNEAPNEKTLVEKEQVRQPDKSEENDKFSAPSTPQLDIGVKFDDELPNCSNSENTNELSGAGKSSRSNSKSVDNTSNSLLNVVSGSKEVATSKEVITEEEVTSENGSKTDERGSIKDSCRSSLHMLNEDNVDSSIEDQSKKKSFIGSIPHSHGIKYSKRKVKVDWTPELHKRFVRAVEQLGIDQAIPSKILELMKVEGLTRHNIASHLQKYRMQRRHILLKDDERRWQANADSYRTCYMQKPVIAVPHIHPNCGLPASQGYPFWGHPSYYANCPQTWGPPTGFPPWHPSHGSWLWKATPAIHADAWGCPVVPPYSQFPVLPQVPAFTNGLDASGGRNRVGKTSNDFNLAEEVIDEVVKEAMSKPWLPLPLGLKPPSVDSVLTELQRQGIPTIPNSLS